MMRFTLPALALSALAFVSVSAHADTYTNFTLTGVLASQSATTVPNGSVNGNLTLDSTTGTFISAYIVAVEPTGTFIFTVPEGVGDYSSGVYAFFDTAAQTEQFALGVPGTSYIGYSGGEICSYTNNVCGIYVSGDNGTQDNAYSGSLTSTPEPSSFVLLGTGLLGVLGAARRRFA